MASTTTSTPSSRPTPARSSSSSSSSAKVLLSRRHGPKPPRPRVRIAPSNGLGDSRNLRRVHGQSPLASSSTTSPHSEDNSDDDDDQNRDGGGLARGLVSAVEKLTAVRMGKGSAKSGHEAGHNSNEPIDVGSDSGANITSDVYERRHAQIIASHPGPSTSSSAHVPSHHDPPDEDEDELDETDTDTESDTDTDEDSPSLSFGHPLTRMVDLRVPDLSTRGLPPSGLPSGVQSPVPRYPTAWDSQEQHHHRNSLEAALGSAFASAGSSTHSLSMFRGSSPEDGVDEGCFSDCSHSESEEEEEEGSECSMEFTWDSWRRDFDAILDELDPGVLRDTGQRSYIDIPPSSPSAKDALLLRHFVLPTHREDHQHRTHHTNGHERESHAASSPSSTEPTSPPDANHELVLLLQLNHNELREDPWNPVPHVVKAIERERGLYPRREEKRVNVVDGGGVYSVCAGRGRHLNDTGGEPDLDAEKNGEKVPEGVDVFIFMEGLRNWDDPPLKTVHNYIDLFRQILEGLAFLHEHHIALGPGTFASPTSLGLMVDIGYSAQSVVPSPYPGLSGRQSQGELKPSGSHGESGSRSARSTSAERIAGRSLSRSSSQNGHSHDLRPLTRIPSPAGSVVPGLSTSSSSSAGASTLSFDRTLYPVKYYFTDLGRAVQFDSPGLDDGTGKGKGSMRGDVVDCAGLFEVLLAEVPKIAPKLRSLVKAMRSGGFGAEDARKLFEAMVSSLEAGVFECPAGDSQCAVE